MLRAVGPPSETSWPVSVIQSSSNHDRIGQRHPNDEVIEANRLYYLGFSQQYDSRNGPRRRIKKHLEQMIAASAARKPMSRGVLDIGTGTGFGLNVAMDALREKATRFAGCDVSPEMLDIASTRLNDAELVLFDGVRLPFEDGEFDLVMLVSMLHHLRDPVPLLHEAARVLSPDGVILIVQEPNPTINSLFLKLRRLLGVRTDEVVERAEYHQFITPGLDPRDLGSVLDQCGLVSRVEYTNAAAVDGFTARLGTWADRCFAPLSWVRNEYCCLNYSIVASGARSAEHTR